MKLHLGCGKRNFGKDWIHIDGSNYQHVHSNDIVNLPFCDNSIDIIYCSHTLEYFNREEVIIVLKKWLNKLKPNGIIRLAVPNFKMYSKLYSEDKLTLDQCIGPLYGQWNMNENKKVYHKTTYDFVSLKKILEEVGFTNIRLWNWKEVDHGIYDDYSQSYIPHMDKENGVLMSLNLEANK